MDILRAVMGLILLLGICVAFSINRRKIDWRLVGVGMSMQIVFAFLVLKVPLVRDILNWVSGSFVLILDWTRKGAEFVFGNNVFPDKVGFVFAFQVLPAILVFSALSSLLYYLGILQRIVYVFAWVMNKTMRLSGAESLAAAANVFLGQTEAPLVVKPYLSKMTRSEILCLMTGGMATIAGSVFLAYMQILGGDDPVKQMEFGTHLLTASIMSAPAAIVAAKILFPVENPDTISRTIEIPKEKIGNNMLEALSNGTTDGLKLAVNVAAMVLVFLAVIEMLNHFSMRIGHFTGLNEMIIEATEGRYQGLKLELILGYLCAPIAWLIGIPMQDVVAIGQLIGEKTVLNEFIAYAHLGEMKNAGTVSERSIIIATYALCGFANFGSIGIQIGGIGSLAPNQRTTLSQFGMRALLGGTVAALLTAAIAGMLI